MNSAIDMTFIRNLVADWIYSLLDLYNTFIGNSLVNVIDILIDMNDKFPFTELINIVLIPFRNIVDGTFIGNLSMLEFTLGFGFSIYLTFTILRWIWNALPLV